MTPRYAVELIGTFFLTFVIAFTGDPLAIGMMLTALIYAGGHVSGAHYNPAITLGFLLKGDIDWRDSIAYVLCQICGAFAATLVLFAVNGKTFLPTPAAEVAVVSAALIEILCTFVLAFVIYSVATSKKLEGNHIYGLAIGFTLIAIAAIGGPISGGVYNPAVALGPMLAVTIIAGPDFSNLFPLHLNCLYRSSDREIYVLLYRGSLRNLQMESGTTFERSEHRVFKSLKIT